MMNEQPMEFIVGYLFAYLEKNLFQHVVRENVLAYRGELSVPKLWFGLRPTKSDDVDLTLEQKNLIKNRLYDVCNRAFPHHTLEFSIYTYNQYIKFDYIWKRKPKVKRLTLKEVEEILGYRVEIIAEDNYDEE